MINANHKLFLGLTLGFTLGLVACGSPAKTKTAIVPAPVASKASASASASAKVAAPKPPPEAALPSIPSRPAPAPAQLTAVLTSANPTSQMAALATFVDAVMPGMGALLAPQTFLLQLGAITGTPGLKGIDLSEPLYLITLDTEEAVIVATVSSEADLSTSLKGSSKLAMFHEGFVAIGSLDALTKAGPYALSNLVASVAPAEPTVSLYLGKIMGGSKAEAIRAAIRAKGFNFSEAMIAEITISLISSIDVLHLTLDANATSATVKLVAEGVGGDLKAFLAAQKPASFSMMERVGSAPWALAFGGRLNLTAFLPFLVRLGEKRALPLVTQVAAQLGSLSGEMAAGFNAKQPSEMVAVMEVSDAEGLGQLMGVLVDMLSKEKKIDLGKMKGHFKKSALRVAGGKLHELKLQPLTEEMKERYGKKGVSTFFGVAGDSLLMTFGPSAKKQARLLASKKGKLPTSGEQLAKVVSEARAAGESFMVALDFLRIQGNGKDTDAAPVVLGLTFKADRLSIRASLPSAVVRQLVSGSPQQGKGPQSNSQRN